MKKLFLFSAVVLLCASFGWAQDQPQSQTPTTDNSNSAQAGTVRGCLSGSDGNYTLTQDQSGNIFKLVGSDDQLKTHMGQEVLVTGQLTAGSSADQGTTGASANANANGSGGTANSSTGTASGGNMVQVTDVKMVSQTCSSGSSAPPSQQ